MILGRIILGLTAGAIIGWLISVIVGIPWAVGSDISHKSTPGNIEAIISVLGWFPKLGALIGGSIPIITAVKRYEAKQRAQYLAANEAALAKKRELEYKQRAEQAALEAKEAALQKQVQTAKQNLRDLQFAVILLPTIIAQAEMYLDRAENEFSEGLYSPFWEAIEKATSQLHEFDGQLMLITKLRGSFLALASHLGSRAPTFSFGNDSLPDPEPINMRLQKLYRQAQKNSQFAIIYEQRRISSKVDRTNRILMEGFTSLGDAIENLGYQISDSINDLKNDTHFRLTDMKSALENAAEASRAQRQNLLLEIQKSSKTESEILENLHRDTEKREEFERTISKMLDNIQRRRKPSSWA